MDDPPPLPLEVEAAGPPIDLAPSVSRWNLIRDAFVDLVFSVLAGIGASLLALIPPFWSILKHGRPLPLGALIVGLALGELSFAYFAFRRLRINRKKGRLVMSVHEGSIPKAVLCGALAGVALMGLSAAYTAVAQLLGQSALTPSIEFVRDLKGNPMLVAFGVLVIAGVAPVCEELLFRVAMFGSARAAGYSGLGAVVASIFFAAAHLSLLLAGYYIVFGLVMCWLFTRTRTIVAPMVAHIAVNAAACIAVLR